MFGYFLVYFAMANNSVYALVLLNHHLVLLNNFNVSIFCSVFTLHVHLTVHNKR